MLKPCVASVPGPVGKLASGLADAGAAQVEVLDGASVPDKISSDGEAGGSLGELKPKIGFGLPAVPPCCVLNGGIKLNGSGLGGFAATGLDALAGVLAGCSNVDPAAAEQKEGCQAIPHMLRTHIRWSL